MATFRCIEMQRIGNVLLAGNGIGAGRFRSLGIVRGTHDNNAVRVVRTDLRNHGFGILLNRVPTCKSSTRLGIGFTIAICVKRFVVQFVENVYIALLLHVARDIAEERLRSGCILVGAMGMVVHNDINAGIESIVNHRFRTRFIQLANWRSNNISAPVFRNSIHHSRSKEFVAIPARPIPEEAHAAQNIRLAILVDDVKTFKR